MTSRERVELALRHQEPDRVPLDLGSTMVTGMQASSVYQLRQALGLDEPGTPVKVVEPYQMLGEIKIDLIEALGVDTVGLWGKKNFFGFANEGWKPWTLFDGTPVLVPERFNTEPDENGDILTYPEGDVSVPPSARMPQGGWYFDSIVRQGPIDDDSLNVEDNLEEFGPLSDEEIAWFTSEIDRLADTDRAVIGSLGGASFGDIALVPAPQLKHPKGIRDIEEWYVSTGIRRGYVYEIFDRQCEIALNNLEKFYEICGNRLTAVFMTGTDFGTQNGPFISPKTYHELFKPFHVRINNWIHENTEWRSFIHSCGSIWRLLDDIVDAGFEILNPVQITAAEMDPGDLKGKYGDRVTFWGGGIDTQKTLPFGSPDEVRENVRHTMRIFGQGGGFVWNSVHNVQAGVPRDNLLALYEAINEYRTYPIT
ncbi:MAG: uroporphyrinogen decarboxylase family protein [Acidimicrobiia bacterium]|nr:MAG: uroporphyrinogen decarboxylase family protein [Acidimicrobiia bacterium]